MSIEAAHLEQHRKSLAGLCYRMLGSVVDADDAVQETIVRAWRSIDGFNRQSSLKTWLHRIATNVCLDALSDRARRTWPFDEGPDGVDEAMRTYDRTHWIEPVPEARVLPDDANPVERLILRQSIRLAFVAALQHLPPKQRAALILTEVLGWSAAEVAETLDSSIASINSALQRARATLSQRNLGEPPPSLSAQQHTLVEEYVSAFESYDIDTLTTLLAADVSMSMPPYRMWLRGRDAIRSWLLGPGLECRGSRLVPVAASAATAFAQYRDGGKTPWALIVLEMAEDQITSMTYFLDTETLFPLFALPIALSD